MLRHAVVIANALSDGVQELDAKRGQDCYEVACKAIAVRAQESRR